MPHAPSANLALWNARTAHHVGSAFYDVPGFLAGQSSLKEIELALLGHVAGKRMLHLQCHFGQDTLSLARMGAHGTGLDFSDAAIAAARDLAAQAGVEARFVCADVLDAHAACGGDYNIVFTSYGVLGWLPDLKPWATQVAACLKRGGHFVMAEFHPVVWMFDNALERVTYPYFNRQAIVENETNGTYADRAADLSGHQSITWNHPLADVLHALLGAGLRLEVFQELDYSPYDCMANLHEVAPGRW